MLRVLLGLTLVIGSCTAMAKPAADNLRHKQLGLPATGLDEYVAQADDSYAWRVVSDQTSGGVRFTVIELTSQTWQAGDVSPGVWKHWLKVCTPKDATGNLAMLFISGGKHTAPLPTHPTPQLLAVAQETSSVVAELHCVPNQPLEFGGDGIGRSEDDLLAECMQIALDTKDPTRLGQLPMAKSAVRAMDALEEWSASDAEVENLTRFVVSGASKRGWTTWLAAAVDRRVAAIIPIVIDVLNVRPSLQHQLDVYGEWSPALQDYQNRGFQGELSHAKFDKLFELIDPYTYRDRFAMPKLIVNATGDEFFLPDSSQFYFDDLPDEKHLTYVPNANHSLAGSNALDSIIGFYSMILADQDRPAVEWMPTQANGWQVRYNRQPNRVRLWQANNPQDRDFRLATLGAAFKSQDLAPAASGDYVVERRTLNGQDGWTASLVEAEFDTPSGRALRLTTPVWVEGEATGGK